MEINGKLLSFFENILGSGREHNKGNFSFKCPWKNHRHSRLWVNLKTGEFQCFACQNLKGRTFYQLLKKINGTSSQFKKLKEILKDDQSIHYIKTKKNNNSSEELSLPDEFWPLAKKKRSLEYNAALKYLKKRNINRDKIKKYNIGYAESGEYSNRIIIPSYNKEGNLNYFVSRTYYDAPYWKYKNPQCSRNIVPFELYISYKLPLIIVEGIFDAISIDYNTIPILGKKIPDKIVQSCVLNDVEYVYLILDGDALPDYFAAITKFLKHDIYVKPIFLEKDKDPADLSKKEIVQKCKESKIVSDKMLLKLKLLSNK